MQRMTEIIINEIAPPPAITAYPHGGKSSRLESDFEFEEVCRSAVVVVVKLCSDDKVKILPITGTLVMGGGWMISPVVAHFD